MNIPQFCNNPVNLMIPHPVGEATGVYKINPKTGLGYAVFSTAPAGWRAAIRQIKADQKRGLTLEKFIFKFAPPNENDTTSYLSFVCHELEVDPLRLLSSISPYALAGVMAAREGYFVDEVKS